MLEQVLWPGDVVLYHGGSLLAKAIRWATREPGEGATYFNHVGLVTQPGTLSGDGDLGPAYVVEALNHVLKRPLSESVKGNEIAIYRPLNLDQFQVDDIVDYMEDRVGDRYGYHKLVLHLLRKVRLPGKWSVLNFGASKWLDSNVDKTPICSYIVAEAFARAGLDFGVDAGLATPDDIGDFCYERRDLYRPLYVGVFG